MKHIARQEDAQTMGHTRFTSHLEGMALRGPNAEGGSGYAEATLRDQGFDDDDTKGVVGSGEPVVKKEGSTQTKERSRWCYFGISRH